MDEEDEDDISWLNDEKDEDDVLDLSWLNDEEKFTNIERLEDKIAMNEIQVKIMYIDSKNTLIHTETEICKLEIGLEPSVYNESIFPRDKLLLLIQSKKKRDQKKYRISELLLYNINLEPENLQNYSKTIQPMNENVREPSVSLHNRPNDCSMNEIYLKRLSTIDDIRIPPSILIFHTINTLYLIFQENTPGAKKTKRSELKGIGFFTKKKRF